MKKVVLFSLIGLMLAHEARAQGPEGKPGAAKVLKLGTKQTNKPLPVPPGMTTTSPHPVVANSDVPALTNDWNQLEKDLSDLSKLTAIKRPPKEYISVLASSVNALKPLLDSLRGLGERIKMKGAVKSDLESAKEIMQKASATINSAVFTTDRFKTGIPGKAKAFARQLSAVAKEIVDFYTKK